MRLTVICNDNDHHPDHCIAVFDEDTEDVEWRCPQCKRNFRMGRHTAARVRTILARHLELAPRDCVTLAMLQLIVDGKAQFGKLVRR